MEVWTCVVALPSTGGDARVVDLER
jgi:hypothetical protein